MTDANLFMPLSQPRVMPCIVYILDDLYVEQNDLQFAYLSGRVTILSSTTASQSSGAVFLFKASAECLVPSACSASNSTHKRCQGKHRCSRGFRQMWKMLKSLLNFLRFVIRNDKYLHISFWTYPASWYCLLWNTPQLHEGSFPTSNSFVPKISAAEILIDSRNLFLYFHYSNLGEKV